MITNYVNDYIIVLVRIAHIICNQPILMQGQILANESVFYSTERIKIKLL